MRPERVPPSVLCAVALACLASPVCVGAGQSAQRPRIKDLMGICGHYHFDGPTYAPVAARVRNYHSINWDLDVAQPYEDPPYPFALNRVNWQKLYGGWQESGFEINASLMMGQFKPDDWRTPEQSAYGYGKAFARFFGPSGKALVGTAELGNEPSDYSDEQYGRIARALARGLKEGDLRIRVATAAFTPGPTVPYARSIACYEDWLDAIDVLTVHTYAMTGKWPNRVRTHPEDPECAYLGPVQGALAWRDENAPGKEVWVTEFGWDAHRAEGAPLEEGTPIHERPSAIGRVQQAQYLARSYLLFAGMGVDRAYVYFYQDDGPQEGLHNASGLISKGLEQPAFHALASLKGNLGDYRFSRVLTADPQGVYVYLFAADDAGVCVVLWSPTRNGDERACVLDLGAAGLRDFALTRAAELALDEGPEATVAAAMDGGRLKVQATGTPRLLFFEPSGGQ